ncbi:DDE superfamily endonuclease [Ceratobasidium sp. AG-Ba]|nr:DDE superfamily endonuclease [Ceratobasidium sp. AG-Ba]
MAPNTSPDTKAMILILKKLGLLNQAIVDKLLPEVQVSRATVGRIVQKYGAGRPVTKKSPRSGRPCKLTTEDAKYAALLLARGKASDATALQRSYFPHVSPRTLRRYLKKIGMRPYRRRKVPLLKIKHRRARRAWARVRLLWPQAAWDDIIFSDESRIELFGPDGSRYCWRHPGQSPYDPRFTKKIVSHGGGGIFVWGCITREGVGRLHRIDGTLTAAKYTEILRTEFLGTLADYKLTPSDIVFQHDRDPKHTARLTTQWLLKRRVNVLPWPSKSPDLNIIEHVWARLKEKVRAHQPIPRNKNELWKVVLDEWKSIPADFIGDLYDSLPRRALAVYTAKGGNTRY